MANTRVAIYSRVSTSKQEAENQLLQLREFGVRQLGEITLEFVDTATGKNGDRDQFKAMFEAASQRKFDVLLFWSLDRLSREGALETLQYLNRLTGYGIQWRSLTEQYLDSTGIFRDAVISILAVVAKQERVRLSERTIAGLVRAKANGRMAGRPRVICDRGKVLAMRQSGQSLGSIATALGLTKTTVHNIVRTAGVVEDRTQV